MKWDAVVLAGQGLISALEVCCGKAAIMDGRSFAHAGSGLTHLFLCSDCVVFVSSGLMFAPTNHSSSRCQGMQVVILSLSSGHFVVVKRSLCHCGAVGMCLSMGASSQSSLKMYSVIVFDGRIT